MIRHIVVHKTITCIYCTEGIKLEDRLLACIQAVRKNPRSEAALDCCFTALREYFVHRNGTPEIPECPVCEFGTGHE